MDELDHFGGVDAGGVEGGGEGDGVEGFVGPMAFEEGVVVAFELVEAVGGVVGVEVELADHVGDAVIEGGDEADVDAGGHVAGDEDAAAADDDDAACGGEFADGGGDALVDTGFVSDLGAVGVGERGEEVGEPGVAFILDGFDKLFGQVVIGGDFFDEFAVPAGPGSRAGVGGIEGFDELLRK